MIKHPTTIPTPNRSLTSLAWKAPPPASRSILKKTKKHKGNHRYKWRNGKKKKTWLKVYYPLKGFGFVTKTKGLERKQKPVFV